MKLRPRLTLFTISLVVSVVAFTSLSTILTLRYLLRTEMEANQVTLFHNFFEACKDALSLGDDLAIQSTSESLEKSVPGLAYAVFVDDTRAGVHLGGIESLQRFKKLGHTCPANMLNQTGDEVSFLDRKGSDQALWRTYCRRVVMKNPRGIFIDGTAFLGFNLNTLERQLHSILGRLWATLIWVMVVVLLFGLGFSFLLGGRITKPIQHLTEGAKAIGDGKLDTKIPIESTDELGFLAHEFNLMAMKLKELDQLKDDFVSSVSHELRSPLSAISGYVELLRNKPIDQITPEKREKAFAIIAESTARLAHFINDILDYAKLKSGHVNLRLGSFDVRATADDLFTLFQPLLDKKQIKTAVDIPANVPVLLADEEKMRQVMTNLLSNALKFTPAGGRIRMWAKNQTEFIEYAVEDSGIGIPEDARETIFEKFKQVSTTSLGETKEVTPEAKEKGTGLGLAIARGIIEAHGGRMWVESEFRKGATFHFTLPNKPIET